MIVFSIGLLIINICSVINFYNKPNQKGWLILSSIAVGICLCTLANLIARG